MNRNEIKANTILALGDIFVIGVAGAAAGTFRHLLGGISPTLGIVAAVIAIVVALRFVGPIVNNGLRPAVERANPTPKPAPASNSTDTKTNA